MNIGRPVRVFACSAIFAALGFIGIILTAPSKGRADDISVWHNLACWLFIVMWLLGLIGLVVSFACWIFDGIAAWLRSKPASPN